MIGCVNLANTRKRRLEDGKDTDLCVFCQNKKSGENLCSSTNGIQNIKSSSNIIGDAILQTIDDESNVKYHMSCYRPYILKGKRTRSKKFSEESSMEEDGNTKFYKERGKKTSRTSGPQCITTCVVCNQVKCKGDTKLYRISEDVRAEQLLKAAKFYLDSVFQRISTLENKERVFAAGLYCHKNCIKRYILNYERDAVNDAAEEIRDSDNLIESFKNFLSTLKLESRGYSISYLRNEFNEKYLPSDKHVSNRKIKGLLIDEFGDDISFTYAKDRTLSQMVFSNKIKAADMAEEIRNSDSIKKCAEILRADIKNYKFGLENADCNAKDLSRSFNEINNNVPESWSKFCAGLFPSFYSSPQVQLKCISVFQILFYLIHNGIKNTPLHIGLAQTIHEMTRSKLLLRIMSRLGITVSYDALERHNVVLATRILSDSDGKFVPLPKTIKPNIPIRAAMDNFDQQEQTLSGIGGSHDTVLVVFQNESEHIAESDNGEQRCYELKGHRSFHSLLPCQQLKYFKKPTQRGKINKDFAVAQKPEFHMSDSSAKELDMVWSVSRFLACRESETDECHIPTWSAFNSMLSTANIPQTITAFTPILPHPATEYSAIYTCMKNFQDCMKTVNQKKGSLWADEGIYRIAREIQLLHPDEFSDIFIGLGGFHLAKEVMSCFGKYLSGTGIENIFIETETFGPNIVESVLVGKHYSRGIRGFSMLAEALLRLLLKAFMETIHMPEDTVNEAKTLIECVIANDITGTRTHAETLKKHMTAFIQQIEQFAECQSKQNETFRYWYQFLHTIFPVLKDLTRAQREGNWDLNVSALMRAIPLFFAFDKINYCRWASVFFEDCLHLSHNFPELYAEFQAGNFVVKNTHRKFSSVAMDQALEQNYNKPSKGHGGIIGMTRRKEAVVLHDLIKHEKLQIAQVLRDYCGLVYEDEYSLHHEFSKATTTNDEQCVRRIMIFMEKQGNPFTLACSQSCKELHNIITKEKLNRQRSTHLLNCIQIGEKLHNQFRKERFEEKSLGILEPIKKLQKLASALKSKEVNVDKETAHALRLIDIARCRGYDIKHLLSYELTCTSLFLTRNGFLSKSDKSQLVHLLESKLQTAPLTELPQSLRKATVVDFMAFARKIPIKSMKIKTYGEFAEIIWKSICQACHNSERIDIILDIYKESSVKGFERSRRSKKQPIEYGVPKDTTPLPVDIDAYWASTKNKELLQFYFFEWVSHKEAVDKSKFTIFIGGVLKGNRQMCFTLKNGIIEENLSLVSDHEEADDRILFHIFHIIKTSTSSEIVICSTDTDVFVNALFHYHETWKNAGLEKLWVAFGAGKTLRYIPLHSLSIENTVPHIILTTLPAIHSLTGCDTTSKVGTKLAALKTAEAFAENLLFDFGKEPLNQDMEKRAEQYLVQVLGSGLHTMDALRFYQYHHKKIRNIQDLAPTSTSIRLHIKRSYLQCYKWTHALEKSVELNPLDYGYENIEGNLVPRVIETQTEPDNFPKPCNCQKCSKESVCPCRMTKTVCCDFCKCKTRNLDNCNNPY